MQPVYIGFIRIFLTDSEVHIAFSHFFAFERPKSYLYFAGEIIFSLLSFLAISINDCVEFKKKSTKHLHLLLNVPFYPDLSYIQTE